MPPMWRPGLSEDDKAKVLGSNRLLPISPRGGLYLTTPCGHPRAAGPRRDDEAWDKDERFAAIFRKVWLGLPRRARMRLRRYWRDESWPYHDSAYSPRLVLLLDWPDRPRYRAGLYAGRPPGGRDTAGHHFVFWAGSINLLPGQNPMPKWHVATLINGMLAQALYFCQRCVDGRTHGFPPPPRSRLERIHANPAGTMAVKWSEKWNKHHDDVEDVCRWFYRNQPKLRGIDYEIRRWAHLMPKDTEIVACDRHSALCAGE